MQISCCVLVHRTMTVLGQNIMYVHNRKCCLYTIFSLMFKSQDLSLIFELTLTPVPVQFCNAVSLISRFSLTHSLLTAVREGLGTRLQCSHAYSNNNTVRTRNAACYNVGMLFCCMSFTHSFLKEPHPLYLAQAPPIPHQSPLLTARPAAHPIRQNSVGRS